MPSFLKRFRLFLRVKRVKPTRDAAVSQVEEPRASTSCSETVQQNQQQQPFDRVDTTSDTVDTISVDTTTNLTDDKRSDPIPIVRTVTPVRAVRTVTPPAIHHATPVHPVTPTSPLESLPAELRREVLFHVWNLEDLRALVLASPVFYQQYLLDRRALLEKGLKTALGNYLVDAYAVQTSASLYDFSHSRHPLQAETIRLFLDNYTALRTATPDVILQECTDEDLLDMSVSYLSLVRPLASRCAALFLTHLDSSLEVGNLSETERVRLIRALYRFQFYCNLFGYGPQGYRQVPKMDHVEILILFFCILKPWEVEEINCIYVLIREQYDAIYNKLRWNFHREHPKFHNWGWPTTPPGSYNLENEFDRGSVCEGTAMRGLQPFYNILRTKNRRKLVRRMRKYAIGGAGYAELDYILEWMNQDTRRHRHPMEGDRMEARGRRERLPFSGDAEDGPPLAWVIVWRRRYSNTYGDVIPRSLKVWGHVFWDRRRMLESKGIDRVLRDRERVPVD